ncbi:MAG: nucleotidyltransferase domain-containing protein [Chloroflexus sp.]|uniref:nucleotidyltransferase domain-containing protein n=1 Tax=Chloroflexus sp. TaxID=1904827 RepID=UPI00404AD759
MPSNTPKPSSHSVFIKSIDRARIEQAVEQYVARLRLEHPEIERVIWFGSWVNGLPSPGSDVALCLIVSATDKPQRERVADFLPVGFPVGIDLFVYTREEFVRLQEVHPGWHASIIAGREL